MASSTSWGIETRAASTRPEVKELVPFIDETVDPRRLLHAGRRGRRLAPGRHAHARARRGDGRADDRRRASRSPASTSWTAASAASTPTAARSRPTTVVIACGVWSPRIARMAGASIPLTPGRPPDDRHRAGAAVRRHGRRDRLPDRPRHGHEHVRAPARRRLRDRLVRPPGRSSWTPTTSPRSPRRRCRRRCCRSPRRTSSPSSSTRSSSFPEILGDERVGDPPRDQRPAVAHARTACPIIGETPEVKGLWSAAAIWIKEAPGIARTVAEWMTHGEPEIDPHGSDIARFYDHHKTARAHRRAHGRGLQQDLRHRPPDGAVGLEPRRPALARSIRPPASSSGAVFFEAAGWERPFWYGANEALLGRVRRPGHAARGRVGVALVVADHQRRAPRDARPGRRWSTCRRSRSSTSPGPARSPTSQGLAVNKVDVPGRAGRLHAAAQRGRRDPRRPHDHAARPRPVPGRDRRRHGHARQEDVHRPPAGRRLGPAPRRDQRAVRRSGSGARAPATSWPPATARRRRHAGFPFLTCRRRSTSTAVRTLASRISYVGELGWEIYVPIEQGLRRLGRALGGRRSRTGWRRSGSAPTP